MYGMWPHSQSHPQSYSHSDSNSYSNSIPIPTCIIFNHLLLCHIISYHTIPYIYQYFLFLEDDMSWCPNGLDAIQYLLKKAELYSPNWLAIRASFGMNGVFIHGTDVMPFAAYLKKHLKRR